MVNHDIYAQRNIHKSILVGGILCLAVVSSTTLNDGMNWYELSLIQITSEISIFSVIYSFTACLYE